MNNAPREHRTYEASPCFQQAYAGLPQAIRRVAARKITLLATNPAHPSLSVHRVRRCAGLWECAITSRYRLLFERAGERLRLVGIGPHGVIDHAHHRRRR